MAVKTNLCLHPAVLGFETTMKPMSVLASAGRLFGKCNATTPGFSRLRPRLEKQSKHKLILPPAVPGSQIGMEPVSMLSTPPNAWQICNLNADNASDVLGGPRNYWFLL